MCWDVYIYVSQYQTENWDTINVLSCFSEAPTCHYACAYMWRPPHHVGDLLSAIMHIHECHVLHTVMSVTTCMYMHVMSTTMHVPYDRIPLSTYDTMYHGYMYTSISNWELIYFLEQGLFRRWERVRMTDSLILEVWHLRRPRTRALMVPVWAASAGLLRARK